MNRNFRDILSGFNEGKVKYLLIGAYAFGAHAIPRATGDIDLWVEPATENAERVFAALAQFGAPLRGISQADFARPGTIYQVGLPPNRIDVLTSVSGLEFAKAWPNRLETDLDGIPTQVLGLDDLIASKRAAGRPKDLLDLMTLEELARSRPRR